MDSIRLVPLAKEHLSDIVRIEKVSNSSPWSEQSFRSELTNPQSVFLVALVNGEVVGFGGLWLVVDEAHITTVAVDPERRHQGIGRKLMLELLELAGARGMTCSTLEVRAGNEAALKLYESLGYVRASCRRMYYPDNDEDAVVMWLHCIPSPFKGEGEGCLTRGL